MPHILYRLPNEENIHELSYQHPPHALSSFDRIGECAGYVFAPFSPSAEHPILFFPLEDERCFPEPVDTPPLSPLFLEVEESARTAYHHEFDRCLSALLSGVVEKIVLARRQTLRLPHPLTDDEQRRLFLIACRRYPESYVALVDAQEQGIWLIASPEVLLSVQAHRLHTMALAGTLPLTAGTAPPPDRWSVKNRREQQLVVSYLMDRLSGFDLSPTLSATYIRTAGHLAHLCTDFHATIPSSLSLGTVVAALHPTPAVCGLPAQQAAALLHEIEQQPRTYYSGFSGPVLPNADTHLFVTLRCLQFAGRQAHLFAGGGLLSESQEEAEWQETQRKMDTMFNLLQ